MTLARISLSYLWKRRTRTALDLALVALAVAAVTLLLLVVTQLGDRIARDARGIDLVVGAAESDAQLVLSAVYGLDKPAGSVPWSAAQAIAAHRGVRRAIPLAFDGRYFGYRIVATTRDYPALYGARLASGRLWAQPLEAVLGADAAARLRPQLGSTFAAAHGAAGASPQGRVYRVVGTLKRTGSVVDGLILTDLASHWALETAARAAADERTVDALLVQYEINYAAREVPYVVRQVSGLGSASPADEAARLQGVFEVTLDVLRVFAGVLLTAAVLATFIALYNGLHERRYDIAVMRTLGATRARVMALLLFEGGLFGAAGALAGIALGHLFASLIGLALTRAQQLALTGSQWYAAELWIVLGAIAIGIATALVPAWRAHEVDIAGTLARG